VRRCRDPLTRFVAALTGPNNSQEYWLGTGNHKHPTEADVFMDRLKKAVSLYKDSRITNEYVDVHNYQFTPQSLSFLVKTLGTLEMIDFTVHRVYEPIAYANEFYLILRKTGS
jgi:hypothetical protein